jgi:predicted DNA binding CopG/RHH family protein
MARTKSETRQLTEGVFVRFTPADLHALKLEADRRGISVQQLLRESTLRTVRAAS